jgi:hypothetical protein
MPSLETVEVDLGDVHPNPWNPNKQSAFMYERELNSIREYGYIDRITVRPHPGVEGTWQILDGEHRWKALRDLGFQRVEVDSVGAIDDARAKALTLILNGLRGEEDPLERAQLVQQILEADDTLINALPYTDAELLQMQSMLEFEWDKLSKAADQDEGADTPKTFSVRLAASQHTRLVQALKHAEAVFGVDGQVAALMCLVELYYETNLDE